MSRVLNLKGVCCKGSNSLQKHLKKKKRAGRTQSGEGICPTAPCSQLFGHATQTGLILKPGISHFLGRCYHHIPLGGDQVAHSWQPDEACLWKSVCNCLAHYLNAGWKEKNPESFQMHYAVMLSNMFVRHLQCQLQFWTMTKAAPIRPYGGHICTYILSTVLCKGKWWKERKENQRSEAVRAYCKRLQKQ